MQLARRPETNGVQKAWRGVTAEEMTETLDAGGLNPETADKVVENVLGVYGLPFGIALNVQVNGIDRLVPMVVEEPSVIAAASNAARMVRSGAATRWVRWAQPARSASNSPKI